MRAAVRTTLAGALALALLGAVTAALWEASRWPVRSVRVAGDLRHADRAALERAIAREAAAGFFLMDVEAVRRAALARPWVKAASVRRAWPDSLHVAVIEREAVARWAAGGLIDAEGAVFRPERAGQLPELPLLAGPEGTHARVLARYRELSRALAKGAPEMRALRLDRRGAWRMELAGGIALELGREPVAGRVAQFARAYEGLRARHGGAMRRVDLRYARGFAVQWEEAPDQNGEGREG